MRDSYLNETLPCGELELTGCSMTAPTPPPVGPSPVESIRGVFLMKRGKKGFRFTAASLPGHLLHFVMQGKIRQSCNGRVYDLGPGDMIWYHENEWVEGEVREAPWIFYSVHFLASTLPPPGYAQRVMRFPVKRVSPLLQSLHAAWQDTAAPGRGLLCQARLLALLGGLDFRSDRKTGSGSEVQLWWNLETKVRSALDQSYCLATLSALAGRSPATISRACRIATGNSPMRRIKQIRLSLAQGLIVYSEMRVNEIARHVGYERLHEFSRDFRSHFGVSPSQERSRQASRTGRSRP